MKGRCKMKISNKKRQELVGRYQTVCNKLHEKVQESYAQGNTFQADIWVERYRVAYRRYRLQVELIKGI